MAFFGARLFVLVFWLVRFIFLLKLKVPQFTFGMFVMRLEKVERLGDHQKWLGGGPLVLQLVEFLPEHWVVVLEGFSVFSVEFWDTMTVLFH